MGFLGVLDHRLQLGQDGTYVDLRRDLGQDTLFFFGRLSADLDIGLARRHTVTMLYQPLDLRTRAVTGRDLAVEDIVFTAGTPIDFRYGFSFWRGSYLFDFLRDERARRDERDTCRRRGPDGGCEESDFVFSLAEQHNPKTVSARTRVREVVAGHVQIVGDGASTPTSLIDILQSEGIMNPTPPSRRDAVAGLLRELYLAQTSSPGPHHAAGPSPGPS